MNFTFLADRLRPTALAACTFFRAQWGVSRFFAEDSIDAQIAWKPTLQAKMHDQHLLCVEVSETPWPASLDAAVLECKQLCLPVRLVVVLPAGARGPTYLEDITRARKFGVGVAEVGSTGGQIIQQPLSLSLSGVRPVNRRSFPPKYRYTVSLAEDTFVGGNPVKGCSDIYDEIESLTRRIYKKAAKRTLWRKLKGGEKLPSLNPDDEKVAWSGLMRTLRDFLDYKRCPSITRSLLDRVLAIVPHRNESSHKPKTTSQLRQRDTQLRTRFENAVDLLSDLIEAARPLRI
jgi:hypothetical protein